METSASGATATKTGPIESFFHFITEDASRLELVGILCAALVGVIGILNGVRTLRRSRAMEFMTQISLTEPMLSETIKMYALLARFSDRKPDVGDLSEEELHTVMAICSFYEFLGLSVLQRLLNREIILLSRYAAMRQTWDTFEGVINHQRRSLQRPHLFGSFEKAIVDFEGSYITLQERQYPPWHASSRTKKAADVSAAPGHARH